MLTPLLPIVSISDGGTLTTRYGNQGNTNGSRQDCRTLTPLSASSRRRACPASLSRADISERGWAAQHQDRPIQATGLLLGRSCVSTHWGHKLSMLAWPWSPKAWLGGTTPMPTSSLPTRVAMAWQPQLSSFGAG